MIVLLRSLVRVLAFLLVALALLGLAMAVSSIGSGTSAPSLPWGAGQLGLPKLSSTVGRFLATLERPGGTATLSALAGLGAICWASRCWPACWYSAATVDQTH